MYLDMSVKQTHECFPMLLKILKMFINPVFGRLLIFSVVALVNSPMNESLSQFPTAFLE